MSTSEWGLLIDRLEERLRRIELSALASTGSRPAVDPGPAPAAADLPTVPATEDEKLRLLALLAAHEQLEQRLSGRRRQLRQAQHYQLGAA